jgi:uncharacterized membrane protein
MPFGTGLVGIATSAAIRTLIPGADEVAKAAKSAAGSVASGVGAIKSKAVAEARQEAQDFFMQKILPIIIIVLVIAFFVGRASANGDRNA